MTDDRTGSDAPDTPPAVSGTAPARPRTTLQAAAVLIAVFLLGGAAGGAVGRLTAVRDLRHVMEGPPAEARARFRLEAMRRHLDLGDDQVAAVRKILDESDAERDRLVASCGPGLDDLHERTQARLREVLSDDQKKRLDELDARRRRPGRGPRPGHPPPDGPPPPR